MMQGVDDFEKMVQTIQHARRCIIQSHFWRQDDNRKRVLLNELNTSLNVIYGISAQLNYEDNQHNYNATGGGCVHDGNVIELFKLSVMTFLHEYRHVLQNEWLSGETVETQNEFDYEGDAQVWSHSIFLYMSPKVYTSSDGRGLFHHKVNRFYVPLLNIESVEERGRDELRMDNLNVMRAAASVLWEHDVF